MGTVGTDGSNWLQIMSSKNNTQVSLCQRMDWRWRVHKDVKFVAKAESFLKFKQNENHDIAIAMSPSRADPVLPWLGVFK